MSEKSSQNDESDVERAAKLLKDAALPVQPGELIGHQIRRAARRTGLSPSRAKAIWYGEARRIEANEMARLAQGSPSIDELKEAADALATETLALDRRAALALGRALIALAERLPE